MTTLFSGRIKWTFTNRGYSIVLKRMCCVIPWPWSPWPGVQVQSWIPLPLFMLYELLREREEGEAMNETSLVDIVFLWFGIGMQQQILAWASWQLWTGSLCRYQHGSMPMTWGQKDGICFNNFLHGYMMTKDYTCIFLPCRSPPHINY